MGAGVEQLFDLCGVSIVNQGLGDSCLQHSSGGLEEFPAGEEGTGLVVLASDGGEPTEPWRTGADEVGQWLHDVWGKRLLEAVDGQSLMLFKDCGEGEHCAVERREMLREFGRVAGDGGTEALSDCREAAPSGGIGQTVGCFAEGDGLLGNFGVEGGDKWIKGRRGV